MTRRNTPPTVAITLTAAEVQTLTAVADYYARSMGPMRHIVRLTTSREMRRRFGFVAEESMWLSRFAQAVQSDMVSAGADAWQADFTPRTLVAFWGRLLSSLASSRSRRKLSASEIARRETLGATLRTAVLELSKQQPELVRAEVQTRRTVEQEWMREQLQF